MEGIAQRKETISCCHRKFWDGCDWHGSGSQVVPRGGGCPEGGDLQRKRRKEGDPWRCLTWGLLSILTGSRYRNVPSLGPAFEFSPSGGDPVVFLPPLPTAMGPQTPSAEGRGRGLSLRTEGPQ